jgi:hypothetical protein
MPPMGSPWVEILGSTIYALRYAFNASNINTLFIAKAPPVIYNIAYGALLVKQFFNDICEAAAADDRGRGLAGHRYAGDD